MTNHNNIEFLYLNFFSHSNKIITFLSSHGTQEQCDGAGLPKGILLAHFLKMSGISPRTWQAAALIFCPYGNYGHNVWLLPHGVPFVGNPKAKQLEKLTYTAFWALAPHLGLALFFYIGVYCPVEIKIMETFNIPMEEHCHFIFVHTHGRPQLSSYVYDGTKVNTCLEIDTTPELAYEMRALRNIQQAIVDKHLAWLHPDAVWSVLADGSNVQAQHTPGTHDTAYAVDQITRGTAMPLSSRDEQMAVSCAFHAWFTFTPRNLDWDKYANYQPAKDVKINEILALDTARQLVIEYYHVADGSRSARSQRVKDLNCSRPFLIGQDVSGTLYLSSTNADISHPKQGLSTSGGWITLGDDVLLQVMVIMAHGLKQPSPLSSPPLGGYSISQVFLAVVFVSLASVANLRHKTEFIIRF
jgi:hypothetical protein